MDDAQAKRIDGLYRNAKQMPILAVLGVLVPLLLLLGAPLGILYASWRKGLLSDIDAGKIELDADTEPKVALLRRSTLVFYVPAMILAAEMVVIALIALSVNAK